MAGDRWQLDASGRVSPRVAILGVGRIGRVVARAIPDAVRVGRGVPLPETEVTWVCVAEDDLVAAWRSVRSRSGAILVQNGLLAPWVERHARGVTTGVLYFAAPARDGLATGSGTTRFFGPFAEHAAAALNGIGLSARVSPSAAEHAREAAFKLGWTCALGLLCGGTRTVGEVLRDDAHTLGELTAELAPVLAAAHGVEVDRDALLASVMAYSAQVADWRSSIKALSWRNGALCAAAARARLRTPLHRRLLQRAGIDVGAASRGASALLYSPA